MTHAIDAENLSKLYQVPVQVAPELRRPLTEKTVAAGLPVTPATSMLWALREVSFKVQPGEFVAVLGADGSGRSTLLNILGGAATQTSGWVEINGRVKALLEGRAGLDPERTGRENVYRAGDLLGLGRPEVAERLDQIAAFAEVEPLFDIHVKHYAGSQQVRLAFATAAFLGPDVLLVDDLLGVTDPAFQRRCWGQMVRLARGGAAVLLVSHQFRKIAGLCQAALLLDKGRLVAAGPPATVIQRFQGTQTLPAGADADADALGQQVAGSLAEHLLAQVTAPLAEQLTHLLAAPLAQQLSGWLSYPEPSADGSPPAAPSGDTALAALSPEHHTTVVEPLTPVRHGDGRARCTRIVLLGPDNSILTEHVTGDDLRVYLDIEAECDLPDMEIGVSLSSPAGLPLISCWTREAGLSVNLTRGTQGFLCHLRRVCFRPGHTINVDLWIGRIHDFITLDHWPAALAVSVVERVGAERFADLQTLGSVLTDHQWTSLAEPVSSPWLLTP